MTVKELIMEVEFDDLLPYLKEIIVGHFDNIYAFREAYDILRGMELFSSAYRLLALLPIAKKVTQKILIFEKDEQSM